MAVGWQRWWGPCPAIDTRTGPSLLARVTQCWALLADFLCLLQTLDRDRDVTHHVGGRVQPERHGGQGHGQGRWGDHPHVLCLLSLLSLGALNGHWGHWCVFTGSLRIQHWLRDWGTVECQSGTRVAPVVTRPGQPPLTPASRWRCLPGEPALTTLRIIAILTFLILQLQLNVTRKWKIHQHNFKLILFLLLCSSHWPWGCLLEVRSDPRFEDVSKVLIRRLFLFTKNWLPRVSTRAPHSSLLTPQTLSRNTRIYSPSPFPWK